MRRSNTSPSMWPSVMPNNSVCAQENNQAKRFTPLLSDTAVQYFRWPLNICIETAHHDLREQKARYTLIIVISSDFDCAWCCVPVGWRIANKLQLALDRIKNVESQMLSMSKVMESKFFALGVKMDTLIKSIPDNPRSQATPREVAGHVCISRCVPWIPIHLWNPWSNDI